MNKLYEENNIKELADAIRSKTYDEKKMKLSKMAGEVQSIDKNKGFELWSSLQWPEKVSKTLVCNSKYAAINPLIFPTESGQYATPFRNEGKVILPNATKGYLEGCREIQCRTIDFYKLESIESRMLMYAQCKHIIIRTNKVCKLSNKDGFYGVHFSTGTRIYVPDELVEEYKVAENWTAYADYIKPLSELEGE